MIDEIVKNVEVPARRNDSVSQTALQKENRASKKVKMFLLALIKPTKLFQRLISYYNI